MFRRFSGLCFAFALLIVLNSTPLMILVSAQDASPVAIESAPDKPELLPESLDEPENEPVAPADETGNTPAGNSSSNPIYALVPTVYLYFPQVTVTGNSSATEGILSDPSSFVAGYRTDNARLFEISTTAKFNPNIKLCIYFGPEQFTDPYSAVLFQFDGTGWINITGTNESDTICWYTPTLGTFVVAEPGTNPTPVPTDTNTPVPADTPTLLPTSTPAPSDTATLAPTDTPTTIPTYTETPFPTDTNTPIPTDTASATHTATLPSTDTPIPTDTATLPPTSTSLPTNTAMPFPTDTPTVPPTDTATIVPTYTETLLPTDTSTAAPSTTPTSTPSPTDTATALPTASDTPTLIPTYTPSATPTAPPTDTSTPQPTETQTQLPTPTATSATGKTQFALPNVWVIFSETPSSGTTHGSILDGGTLPSIPAAYHAQTAWFFAVSTTVSLISTKQLCVLFAASDFVTPAAVKLLRRDGPNWTPLTGQILIDLDPTQGTVCGYTPTLGGFALAELLPATLTPTASPSRTIAPTFTPTITLTPTSSSTATPTSTPTFTPPPSATATATPTQSPSSTPTPTSTSTSTTTSTPTLEPGSYSIGTPLRATTRVNLRANASTSSQSLGVVAKNALVTVTGSSIFAGNRYWIPVSAPGMGTGWIAGDYLTLVAAPTPTSIPSSVTIVPTTPASTATQPPIRPPGGFVSGDMVQTTASLNLRSGPNTSSKVLAVLPNKTTGQITGDGVRNGSNTFYPVLFDGRPAGYVAGKYLQLTTAPSIPTRVVSPTPTFAGVPIRFTTSNVNMRSGPGTGNRIVATLPKGTRVNITGIPRRSGGFDWYPVAVYGIGPGWVAGKFLSITGPV